MKSIQTFLIIATTFCLGFAQAQTQSAPVPSFNYDQISTGKMAVIEKLADATFVEIICESPSALLPFKKQIRLDNIQSTDDIKKAIDSIGVTLKYKNPADQFDLKGYVKDATGETIFQAESSFFLEKRYPNGKMVYQMPEWSNQLYFWCKESKVAFPGIVSAFFVSNGQEYPLAVEGGGFTVWSSYDSDAYIKIVTKTSEVFYYDYNTGKRIPNVPLAFNSQSFFFDFQKVEMSEDGVFYIQVQPEYYNNPWIEITVPESGEVMLSVSSVEFVRPVGGMVTTLDEIKRGEKPQQFEYNEFMRIYFTPGSKIYFFFDYPTWVSGWYPREQG